MTADPANSDIINKILISLNLIIFLISPGFGVILDLPGVAEHHDDEYFKLITQNPGLCNLDAANIPQNFLLTNQGIVSIFLRYMRHFPACQDNNRMCPAAKVV